MATDRSPRSPGNSTDDPSRAEIQQRVTSLYDRAETDTGTFNATRAASTRSRGGGGRGTGDQSLEAVAKQWFDSARTKVGPTTPAVLPSDRQPPRPARPARPAPAPERSPDSSVVRELEAAARRSPEPTGRAIAALPAVPQQRRDEPKALAPAARALPAAPAAPASPGAAPANRQAALKNTKEQNGRKLATARELLARTSTQPTQPQATQTQPMQAQAMPSQATPPQLMQTQAMQVQPMQATQATPSQPMQTQAMQAQALQAQPRQTQAMPSQATPPQLMQTQAMQAQATPPQPRQTQAMQVQAMQATQATPSQPMQTQAMQVQVMQPQARQAQAASAPATAPQPRQAQATQARATPPQPMPADAMQAQVMQAQVMHPKARQSAPASAMPTAVLPVVEAQPGQAQRQQAEPQPVQQPWDTAEQQAFRAEITAAWAGRSPGAASGTAAPGDTGSFRTTGQLGFAAPMPGFATPEVPVPAPDYRAPESGFGTPPFGLPIPELGLAAPGIAFPAPGAGPAASGYQPSESSGFTPPSGFAVPGQQLPRMAPESGFAAAPAGYPSGYQTSELGVMAPASDLRTNGAGFQAAPVPPAAVPQAPVAQAPVAQAAAPQVPAPPVAAPSDVTTGTTGAAYLGKADKALAFARAQIGRPCVWGATGPESYDCSSLTQAAWKAAGVTLPRAAIDQARDFTRVSLAELRPGDLVFFFDDLSHTGLCTGNGMMIHAPGPGSYIREEAILPFGEGALRGAVRPL